MKFSLLWKTINSKKLWDLQAKQRPSVFRAVNGLAESMETKESEEAGRQLSSWRELQVCHGITCYLGSPSGRITSQCNKNSSYC